MKKIICYCFMMMLIFLTACSQEKLSKEVIQFPQMASRIHGSIPVEFSLDDDAVRVLGQDRPVYRIVTRKTEKGTEDGTYYDGCLFKVFANDVEKTTAREGYTRYECRNGDRLDIYDKGSYVYRRKGDSAQPLSLSDAEAIQQATAYLRTNALLPDGFAASQTLGGTKTDTGAFLTKTIGFFRKIDGCDFYGRSDITVEIDALGVRMVSSIYSDYVFDQNVACRSYEEVKKLHPLQQGQIVYDTSKLSGEADHIQLENVTVLYYDSPVNQPELSSIQPVYQFSGKIFDKSGEATDYYWTVAAIKE